MKLTLQRIHRTVGKNIGKFSVNGEVQVLHGNL